MPKPPDAVTGVNGGRGPARRQRRGRHGLRRGQRRALTVRRKVFDEVCAVGVVWSVTVTVKVVVASVAVGVPVIWPVEVLKLRPVGSVPPRQRVA